MSDAPEIPEASNPFQKRVALTIAMLAVVLSLVNNLGDNAKTDAIIKTNEATDEWMYFQAKGIKEQMATLEASLLNDLGGVSATAQVKEHAAKATSDAARYESEKDGIKKKAEDLQKQAAVQAGVNDRCDLSSLILQIAVVVCSVAILANWNLLWYMGLALGAVGTALGVTAFMM